MWAIRLRREEDKHEDGDVEGDGGEVERDRDEDVHVPPAITGAQQRGEHTTTPLSWPDADHALASWTSAYRRRVVRNCLASADSADGQTTRTEC